MQTTMRKILSAVLVFVLLLGMMPMAAMPAAAESELTQVSAWNLVLADEIAVNFCVSISDAAAEDAVMQVTDGYGTTAYPIAEAEKNEDGLYQFTGHLAAAQLTDSIQLQLISGGETGPVHSYSAAEYAQAILSGDYSQSTKDLVLAMLGYGAAAQLYFGYNTDKLANAGYESTEVLSVPEAADASMVSGSVNGASFYAASLLNDSRVAVRFYFNVTGQIGDYTFTTASGKTCTPGVKNGLYYVDVPGINPQNYDKAVKLQVSDGTDTMTVSYSPMAYITRMYANSSNEALRTMVAAMYQYHLAAKAYLSVSGSVTTDGSGIVTEQVILQGSQSSAVVAAGTQLEENTTTLTLSTTAMNETGSDVVLSENEQMVSMDVHVEGVAQGNTVPVLVTLNELAPEFLNQGNITLYHVENGETVEMTRVYSMDELDAHNEYYYDIITGTVTVALASFSEIAVRSSSDNAWNGNYDYNWYDASATELTIANADQLAGFGAIVGGMNGQTQNSFDGKTVTLLSDIDLDDEEENNVQDKIFYPIGYYNEKDETGLVTKSGVSSFEGTFDGNGHTIANFYQSTWEMEGDYRSGYTATDNYYNDAMGLFGYVLNGTVKNLTVKQFASDGEFTPTGVIAAYADNATFENIAIVDCNPRVYNTGNGGIVGIGGSSNDTEDDKLTFSNITIDNSNTISALWGSWDVACGGLVGMFRGAGHVYMTNCHVAAQIDVYNDVCGNYQYYWYRYAGMLVGTNTNMITENGYTVPETSKFHAENCTVHFGEWNDYYYCELVANSLASYTHDHQFSRLEQITSLDAIYDGQNWTQAGNFLLINGEEKTCYHIVEDEDGNLKKHNHADSGYETTDVDGDGNVDSTLLKEDKQIVYLPFNQLFTGYGWGVDHIPVYDNAEENVFPGVTILGREVADSVEKFVAVENAQTSFVSGAAVTVGELFQTVTGAELDADNVQVFVSPVGTDSTASGTYTANTTDWTQGTLTFSGSGAAEIIITDYYYCIATTLNVVVENAVVRFYTPDGVSSADCDENGVVLEAAAAPEGKTFIGWSETEIAETQTSPEVLVVGETYHPKKTMVDLYAVYSYTVDASSANDYEEIDFAEITSSDNVVITMTANNTTYALSSENGSSKAPTAVAVTVNGTKLEINDVTNLLWIIKTVTEGYTIYPAGTTDTWLYCTNTNNGVRVGTNENNVFTIDSASGYLKNTATSRYVGVYTTTPDWRCYTNTTGNIASQSLKFYKEVAAQSGAEGEITYFVTESVEKCAHINTTTTTVDATCQSEGSKTVFCNDCREQVGDAEILPVTAHSYVDGVCSACGNEKTGDYILVTNAADLTVGDKVIIVASESDVAMSTVQNDNNRGQVSITKNDTVVEVNESVQVLTLAQGNKDNTLAFYTGEGYLYAASSSSNQLKTETTLSDNSSWTIEIDAASVATVTAQGTNTRNQLKKNSSSALFSCYSSGQDDICIYKWKTYCQHTQETENIITVAPTCTEAGYSYKICDKCSEKYDVEEIPATKEHTYTNGTCSVCGAVETGSGSTTKNYEKVTTAPTDWSGTYLIVYEDGGVAFNGGLGTLDAASNTISITISDSKIESNDTTNAAAFTINKDGTTIQSASGYYIGHTSDANKLSSSTSTVYTNTISFNNDGSVNIKCEGGAYLRYNASSGQERFRYYKSSSYTNQKAIYLYKLEG